MKKVILLLFIIHNVTAFAQESFTMKYGCRIPMENGVWGDPQKVFIQIDFSVGSNKDIVFNDGEYSLRFERNGNPYVSETKNGMRYQIIPVTNGGEEYLIQYMENYNLRLISLSNQNIEEYGCVYDFDEQAGTNHNLYSVISKRAYFHNEPNKKTKRNAYLIYGEVVEPLAEINGFYYVKFTNTRGITSKGWILKSNLVSY